MGRCASFAQVVPQLHGLSCIAAINVIIVSRSLSVHSFMCHLCKTLHFSTAASALDFLTAVAAAQPSKQITYNHANNVTDSTRFKEVMF